MKSHNSKLTASILSLLTVLACNIGLPTPSTSNPLNAAATIVAMTLQAQGLPTSAGVSVNTPFASPVPVTPTFAKPLLYINKDNTQCKSGSGADFKTVASFTAGTTLDMAGKDTADGYWLVRVPGSADTCWIYAGDATPGGDFQNLPEITPVASTQHVPARPGLGSYNFSCDNSSLTTSLKWIDLADNENGYHVYRLGNQIADLPANSTTYTETIPFVYGSQITYAVEAYNEIGASPQRVITFKCPP